MPPRTLFTFLALAGLGCACAGAAPQDSRPVVAVTGGLVRGSLLPDGRGAVFKGVPFARPPVGALRWREPMPVIPWEGVREADHSGPPAEQARFGWNDKDADAGSEDCLYLDVWTPDRASPGRTPVMVWIHGGGNVGGAGGFDPLYDGRALIAHGVVLVVVEYRLGIFGMFAHPELTRESPHHASGNYEILDQVAALQWVHDNIARFGGDPSNTTVFGQSAGGTDVLALMASPLSAGLFQRAVSESGPLDQKMTQTLPEGERSGVGAAADLPGGGEKDLAYLRSLPPAELLKVQRGLKPFTVDGWVFPETPIDAWRAHHEQPVPLIVGSNAVEFPATGNVAKALREYFGDLAPRALALYGVTQGGAAPSADPLYGDAADQWGSDVFRCTPIILGEWHSRSGSPTWEYEFDRAIPPHRRVAHSGDLPYVFGNLSASGSLAGDYQEADRWLSNAVQTYWTRFARAGDPNGPDLPPWPGFDPAGRKYLDFDTSARVVEKADERGPFCDLFRRVLEKPSPAR